MTREEEYRDLYERTLALPPRLRRLGARRGALADAGELATEAQLIGNLYAALVALAELERDVAAADQAELLTARDAAERERARILAARAEPAAGV